jgi:hypothetical protein
MFNSGLKLQGGALSVESKATKSVSKINGASKSIERRKKVFQERQLIEGLKDKGLFLNEKNLFQEAMSQNIYLPPRTKK